MDVIGLFPCGDAMTGRGIDQILARPCDPAIHEGYLESALDYVELAEFMNGAIPRRVQRAAAAETRWLCAVLDREGARFGTGARLLADGRIELERVAQAREH